MKIEIFDRLKSIINLTISLDVPQDRSRRRRRSFSDLLFITGDPVNNRDYRW